tara:strand:+ start:258 stop:1274 length:1017 start_codon:yes stop_codon:yes gene_type:complete
MRVLAKTDQTVKLDLINQKILYLLAQNARFSYSTIAKQVKLSREAVKQRIQRLQEKEVILGFQALIAPKKLNLNSYHLFVKLTNLQPEFTQRLVGDKDINALIQYNGKFDFEISYLLQDLNQFNNKIKKLNNLKNYEICLLLGTLISKTYPGCMYNFTIPEFKVTKDGSFNSEFKKTKESKIKLDQTDFKLLQALSNNSRFSTMNLSLKLNLSVDAVIYRIKKLISHGIIKEFRPIINYAALGYSVYSLFLRFKDLTSEKEAKFKQFVKQHQNFLWSVNCLGNFNNLSYLIVKDTFEFHQVITELRKEFHDIIDSYETMLSFAEHKYTYFPERILKEK